MKPGILPDHAVSDALEILLKHLQIPGEEMGGSSHIEDRNEPTTSAQLRMKGDRMESVITAFTNIVKYRIASIRRKRNQFCPIYRLPAEILGCVFEALVGGHSDIQDSYYCSANLSKVSSYWRGIAISTPRLWTHLYSRLSGSSVEASITRSRNAPLEIFIEDYETKDNDREALFIQMVVPHLHRWETFNCFSNISHTLLLPHLENKSFPLLRTFIASFYELDPLPMPLAISHNAPRLQTLTILPYSFPLGSPVLSRLKSIMFRPEKEANLLLPEEWQSFLSSAPELEFIHVEGVDLEDQEPQTVTLFQAFLPRLKTLILTNLPMSIIGLLLSSISSNQDTPPQVVIDDPRMDEGDEDDNGDESFKIMFPRATSKSCLLASIRMMTLISVEYSEARRKITVKAGLKKQSDLLHYEGYHALGLASDLWGILVLPDSLPNLRYINLRGSQFFSDEVFSATLHRCSSLERLVIRCPDPPGENKNLYDICNELGLPRLTQTSPYNHSYIWLCPNLKRLGLLVGTFSIYIVASMLKNRYRSISPDATVNRLFNLEELKLSFVDQVSLPEILLAPSMVRLGETLTPLGTVLQLVGENDFDESD